MATWQDRTAMTAALAFGADDLLLRDKSNTTDHATEGTVLRLPWEALLAVSGLTPGGRLTTESGVPVSSSDRTSQGTLYYTPYLHDYIRLYDGTRPKLYLFTERSLSLTMTSGKNYDVFLYDNSGTLTMELSAAWTNDTTRADALAWQSGVGWVKSGSATRLWLGTIRASGTNVTEDSWDRTDAAAKAFIWNAYNRVRRAAYCHDSNDSWTYTTYTWRQARGSANNQIEYVTGVAGLLVEAVASQTANNASAVSIRGAIGLDSSSAPASHCDIAVQYSGTGITLTTPLVSSLKFNSALGYHYLARLERSAETGTTTWYGDGGAATDLKTSLNASLEY